MVAMTAAAAAVIAIVVFVFTVDSLHLYGQLDSSRILICPSRPNGGHRSVWIHVARENGNSQGEGERERGF